MAALDDLLSFGQRFVDQGDLWKQIMNEILALTVDATSTHIINAQYAITGLDAKRFVDRSMGPDICYNQGQIAATAKRETQTAVLALHRYLGKLCGHT